VKARVSHSSTVEFLTRPFETLNLATFDSIGAWKAQLASVLLFINCHMLMHVFSGLTAKFLF
jgi:hypothetical protein